MLQKRIRYKVMTLGRYSAHASWAYGLMGIHYVKKEHLKAIDGCKFFVFTRKREAERWVKLQKNLQRKLQVVKCLTSKPTPIKQVPDTGWTIRSSRYAFNEWFKNPKAFVLENATLPAPPSSAVVDEIFCLE